MTGFKNSACLDGAEWNDVNTWHHTEADGTGWDPFKQFFGTMMIVIAVCECITLLLSVKISLRPQMYRYMDVWID